MEVKTTVKIHNRFDIIFKNAETGEIVQRGHAENIVLNRMYERLCNFNSYFTNIVFGTGTGTLSTSRTTLFNRLGYKAAATEELVKSYPTSKLVKKITLGTEEHNGYTLTEVGISNDTTQINTHAIITDAEGNPLSILKHNLLIVDIYATVFIEIYDFDAGLFWYDNGLRDYLTGGSSIGNALGISNLKAVDIATINGTKTIDVVNKTVTISGRFNIDSLNKDARFLYWTSAGLICEVPRVGVTEGEQVNNLQIGVGDGVNKNFSLGRTFNTPLENIVVKVDGVVVNYTYNKPKASVTLDTAPDSGKVITASYKSLYFPKTAKNVLDVSFKTGFGLGQPTPIVPTPPITIPGESIPIAGDTTYGFYGEVSWLDLISGDDLASYLGLTAGASQYSRSTWLKFALDGKILFVAKKPLRSSISWDNINAVNAVFGNREIVINGFTYKVRLMKTGLTNPMPNADVACHGSEWNKLMLPIHIQAKDKSWAYPANVESNVPYWGIDYTDQDLLTNGTNGSYCWCQETYSSYRVRRGGIGVSYSYYDNASGSCSGYGWRPVLELVA